MISGYRFLRLVLNPFYKIVWHAEVVNAEVIPEEGGMLFAGNHRHWADPMVLACTMNRDLTFLAKRQLFESWMGPFVKWVGCIPVDQDRRSPHAVPLAVEAVKSGKAVCIFPEGHRNRTQDPLLPFKSGAVRIARESGCPIVPFAIRNPYTPFRNKLVIVYGEPYYVDPSMTNEEAVAVLKEKILKLYTGE